MSKISQLHSAEFARTVFAAVVPPEDSLDVILEPEYWMHVARKLRKNDRVEVNTRDGSYFAELMVVSTGLTWVRMAVLRHIDLTKLKVKGKPKDDLYAKFGSEATQFRVLSRKSKTVIKDGFPDMESADAWIAGQSAQHQQEA